MRQQLGFNFADLYGRGYGYTTTKSQTIPEQSDQEALIDSTAATNDVHTEPKAGRNMWIALVVILVMIVLFSVKF